MSKSLPILIIGAGVAGPTLAVSLHQKGYKVILFEKYDAPSASLTFYPYHIPYSDVPCLYFFITGGTGASLMLMPNG
jgi:glycine/D-amino acid oxidase-like deaminating enzyme